MSIISGAYHVANLPGHLPKHKLVWLDNNVSKEKLPGGESNPALARTGNYTSDRRVY